jgi:protein import protein ZIM17
MASKLTPFRTLRTLSRLSHSRPTSRYNSITPLVSRQPQALPIKPLSSLRFSSTSTSPSKPQPEAQSQTDVPILSTHEHKHKPHAPPSRSTRPPQPEYEMTFTCKPCGTRSSHRVSKQGYHFGSVLITCPECRNRHVISDHLKVSEEKTEERVLGEG